MSKHKDTICGGVGIIFSIILYALSAQIGQKENATIGAAFLPKIVAVVFLIISVMLTLSGIKESKKWVETKSEYKPNYKGVLVMVIAIAVYIVLLKPIGFIITSIVFLFATLCIMSKKEETNYVKFLILSVVAVLLINVVFMEIFGIRIPQGIL